MGTRQRRRGAAHSADPAGASRERVLALLERHGWNATSFQVLGAGFRYWFAGDDACVGYVDTGRAWVAAGPPIAAPERLAETAAAFARAAAAAGRRVCIIALASGALPRCVVLTSDQRVTMASRGRYVYPDVSIVCGGVEIEAGDVLLNPTILVEVLSATTEQYDRGLKWEGYQRITSLVDYVLVSQTEPRIEHYRRAADGSWTYRAAGRGERVTLSTGAALIVDEVFAGVLELPGD